MWISTLFIFTYTSIQNLALIQVGCAYIYSISLFRYVLLPKRGVGLPLEMLTYPPGVSFSRFFASHGRPVTGDDGRDALQQRMEAERERRPTSDAYKRSEVPAYSVQLSSGVPAYSFQQTSGIPVRENGSVSKGNLPEPYFTMTCRPQTRTFSEKPKMEAAPSHNAMGAGGVMPMETDIDQYLEEQRVLCLSRPMPVLETDLDSLPETRASPTAMWSTHGGSLVDLLLEGGLGAGKRTDLMGELLPYGGEGQAGRETWRGGGNISGLRTDTARR